MASTLIHNVRIFDGETIISESGSLFIENGLITHIETTSKDENSPKSADVVIDGAGKTLLPGLIDAHVHAHGGEEELRMALEFGVTTVLDLFSEPEMVAKFSMLVKERDDIADYRSSCFGATIKGGWPAPIIMATTEDKDAAMKRIARWPQLETKEDAEAFVKDNVEKGASYIKLFHESASAFRSEVGVLPLPSLELQTAVVDAAHSHGLLAIAHSTSLKDTLDILSTGIDGLAHCFCDKMPTKEVLELCLRGGVFTVPTLVVSASSSGEENESTAELAKHDFVGKHVHGEAKECFCKKLMLSSQESTIENAYATVRMLKEGGVDIVAGTDSGTGVLGTAFGLSLHQELYLYANRCGFTPSEALKSATATTARRFKMTDRGMIKEGLRADLLLVKGDPTKRIGDTLNIEGVWRGGKAVASLA